MDLEARFVGHVRERGLLRPGEGVLVACSAGADSTALARAVAAGAAELRLGRAALAHFDHALRPDSAADARFVRALARKLGVPAVVRRGRVEPAPGESPEEAARRARYAFLADAAAQEGAAAVLTAHHLDDQAETILYRLLTGTGPAGLAGIREVRPLAEGSAVRIVRPLLPFRRSELREYLQARRQSWREDPTNEGANVRARLRRDAFPLLAEIVGRDPVPLLERFAVVAAEASSRPDPLREIAGAFVESRADGRFVVHAGFRRLPASLRRAALREPIRRLRRDEQPPSRAEVERLDRLLRGIGVESVRGIRIRARPDGTVSLERRGDRAPAPPLPRLRIEEAPASNAVFLERLRAKPGRMEIADAAAVRPPLSARRPAPGDQVQVLGRDRPQRLTHYLQRRGVSADDRGNVPLVCDADGIVWVVGHAIAARAAVTESTTRILALRID